MIKDLRLNGNKKQFFSKSFWPILFKPISRISFPFQLHHIQHYTGQLAKETTNQLRELNTISTSGGSEQRQWRLQRERLHNDLTKALNTFQNAQRTVAQKEKEFVKRAKNAVSFGAAMEQETNLVSCQKFTLITKVVNKQLFALT